jgi:hypothetical protein
LLLVSSVLHAAANDSIEFTLDSGEMSVVGTTLSACPPPSVTGASLPFQVLCFGGVAFAIARWRRPTAPVLVVTSAAMLALVGPAREAWWIYNHMTSLDPALWGLHVVQGVLLVVLGLGATMIGAVVGARSWRRDESRGGEVGG